MRNLLASSLIMLVWGCGGGGSNSRDLTAEPSSPPAVPSTPPASEIDDPGPRPTALDLVAAGQVTGYDVSLADEGFVALSVRTSEKVICDEVFVGDLKTNDPLEGRRFEYVERAVHAANLAESEVSFFALPGSCEIRTLVLER